MMEWLTWQQPWWLLLAAIPWLARLVSKRWHGRPQSQLEQFIARHLWPQLLSGAPSASHYHTPLFMVAWLLACVALAGPTLQTAQNSHEIKQQANIAIVLDISPSMRVQDILPSRLDYSKRLLSELAQQLRGQQVALIVFSANAYTVLPLTRDNQILTQMIEAMDPTLASVTGSNLSRALQLAQQALAAPPLASGTTAGGKTANGLVLLISDGEIHDSGALAASRQLRQAGHMLYTLGVGTEQGGPVPYATGRLVTDNNRLITSRLNRETLRTLAQSGGGHYADLRPEVWPAIMQQVDALKQPIEGQQQRRTGTPLFPWFLALALALFLWNGVRRPNIVALFLLLPLIGNSPATEAAPWSEAKGLALLDQGQNQAALDIYNTLNSYSGHLGRGVAAYRFGQWQPALKAFDRALTLATTPQEKGLAAYNRGNALVQLNQIDDATRAYKTALHWLPNHPKSNHNLTLLQRNPPKSGERKGSSKHERQDESGSELSDRSGSDNSSVRPNPALTGQTGQQTTTQQRALQQSLTQWGQQRNSLSTAATPSQQQLNTLKEDYQTMLKQRFAAEDISDAAGLVVEKPW